MSRQSAAGCLAGCLRACQGAYQTSASHVDEAYASRGMTNVMPLRHAGYCPDAGVCKLEATVLGTVAHCGACGKACTTTEECVSNTCLAKCLPGE